MSAGQGALWLGHYCLGHVPLKQRWEAVSGAGFAGISTAYSEIVEQRAAGVSEHALREDAAALGLRLTELEYCCLLSDRSRTEQWRHAEAMVATADALGCDAVTAIAKHESGFVDPDPALTGPVARNLQLLADACAARGLQCTVEFMPFVTAIDTLQRARDLLDQVDRDNVKLTVDAIHFVRAGPDWDGLAKLAPSDVHTVQLCDAPLERPDLPYLEESLHHRRRLGEGELDLARFVGAMPWWDRPFTVEVLAAELRAMPPDAAARSLADSTRRQLATIDVGRSSH